MAKVRLPAGVTAGKTDTNDSQFVTGLSLPHRPHSDVIEPAELADWRRTLHSLSPALLTRWALEIGDVDPRRHKRRYLFSQMIQLEIRRRRDWGTL